MKKMIVCVAFALSVLVGNSTMTKEDCPKTVPYEVENGTYSEYKVVSRDEDGTMFYIGIGPDGHEWLCWDYTVRYL